MNYLIQILFFFGAFGVFNSFLVAIYFLIKKEFSNLENRLFALFLLALNIRVLKSLFYAFSTEEPIWFLQYGPSSFLLIGPLLFHYVMSVIYPKSFWTKYWKYHILCWLLIVLFLMVFIPFKDNNELNKTILLPIINLQWFIYLLLSGVLINKHYKNIHPRPIQFKWLSTLTFAVLIIWTSFAFTSFDYFVSGSILFTILFYAFFLFFLFKRRITSNIFKKLKPKNKKALSKEEEVLVSRLKTTILNEKLFTNSDLKLSDVAKRLNLSTHELSKLINEALDKSFTDFVNEYRIKEAAQLIKNNSLFTIEAIGQQSGFNSKSAFYKAFKKLLGTTPAKYKKKQ